MLCPELFSILPHDRLRGLQPDPSAAPLVHIRTLRRNPPNDILSRQNRCHKAAKSGYKGSTGPDIAPKRSVWAS
jgi:hypothetical protein